MYRTADRKGNITEENSIQDRFLKWMYGHMAGRMMLRPLVSPTVSKLGGKVLSSGLSRVLIGPFIRANHIQMEEYERGPFRSYNDFFQRRLVPGARITDMRPERLVSPCDGRLTVSEISDRCVFQVKHTRYTVESLLRNRRVAKEFAGGNLWVFRLCVDDYHRYIYVDHGAESSAFRVPGVFHTVNPVANEMFPIYKENTREYSLLRTSNFGTILQMEVGALLVGKIENHRHGGSVKRGQEKGAFAFGGSTIILMTQKGIVVPDRDILKNSRHGIETKVQLGEGIGSRR